MCDLGIALTLLSTGLGMAGDISEGQAQKESAYYNADVEDTNAALGELRARDAIVRGTQDQKIQKQETAQLIGKQKVQGAAGNLDVTYGSLADLNDDTAMLGELDNLTIRTNAYREAYDHRVGAKNSTRAAEISRKTGRSAVTSSVLGAIGTGIGGAGKAYSAYKKSTAFI